ncbi:uncharacterized protein BJ212DRAFT_804320, partial [Suillus subaureus]
AAPVLPLWQLPANSEGSVAKLGTSSSRWRLTQTICDRFSSQIRHQSAAQISNTKSISMFLPDLKMSDEKHPGGRPPARIITDNSTELERVNNKSRRKFWKCNYCTPTSGSGQRIEGRDNCCLLHLTNPKECPDAPSSTRNEARKVLMQKGAAIGQTEAPLFHDTSASEGIVPAAFEDDIQQVGSDSEDGLSWDVQSLLTMKGVSSM